MSDLNGEAYAFEHKQGGRKNELRARWARFVTDKGLRVDDTVFIIRRSSDHSFIEARCEQPAVDPVPQPLEELTLARNGAAFTVTYYPARGSGSPFVVPRGAVDEALAKHWEGGMRVLMRPRDLVLHGAGDNRGARFERVPGTITEVTADIAWRKLKVNVSGSPSSWNCWEVDAARGTPAAAKRSKVSADAQPPSDDQSKQHAKKKLRLMGSVMGTKQGIDTC